MCPRRGLLSMPALHQSSRQMPLLSNFDLERAPRLAHKTIDSIGFGFPIHLSFTIWRQIVVAFGEFRDRREDAARAARDTVGWPGGTCTTTFPMYAGPAFTG